MLNLTHARFSTSLAMLALLGACGSTPATPDTGTPVADMGVPGIDSGPSDGSLGRTHPPTIGTQIDRMGRPGITTALVRTFHPDAERGAAHDAYNQASNPTAWTSNLGAMTESLAILDSLDTNCGNQAFAGTTAVAGRYDTLGGVLVNDRLWVNSATASNIYLAVEANATGFLANTDGGGRPLSADVIDETYSLLAVGAISGVGDGVDADADTSGITFPYLANPH